jgi:hypothetical protein
MKGIAALMVLSLFTRSHPSSDDRRYDYSRPEAPVKARHAAPDGYTYPSQSRIFRPVQ